jgi:hypothetical protein
MTDDQALRQVALSRKRLITWTVIELIRVRSTDQAGRVTVDRAISVQLATVIKGQEGSRADTCPRRSAAIWGKIGLICKQEVRGSNPLGSTSQNASVRSWARAFGPLMGH